MMFWRPSHTPGVAGNGDDVLEDHMVCREVEVKRDMRNHAGQAKIAADVDSADLSGVSGTPTFFINGIRHHQAYDLDTPREAVRTARARALIEEAAARRPPR
jgi:protein-disulfide isomerase